MGVIDDVDGEEEGEVGGGGVEDLEAEIAHGVSSVLLNPIPERVEGVGSVTGRRGVGGWEANLL